MQRQESSPFRIRPRILMLFLILGIPPLVLSHVLLVTRAENRFRDVVGGYFGDRAEQLQVRVVDYLEKLQSQVVNLSTLPEIQDLVNAAYKEPPSEATFAEELQRIEAEWPSMDPANSRFLSDLLGNSTSRFLSDYSRAAGGFRELIVTDRYGRLVAASGKTTDYFQADEPWWRVAFLEGNGQPYVSDVEYDESVGLWSIQIAEPIRDESTGMVLGVIKGVADSHELFGMLDSLEFGNGATAVLLRPDGTLATSPGSEEIYPYTKGILAGMERGRRWMELPEDKPGFFVGLPEFSVSGKLPNLNWIVVVESPRDEVFTPFSNLRQMLVYIAVLMVAIVIGLSIFFTWVLSKPIIETDPHLQEV